MRVEAAKRGGLLCANCKGWCTKLEQYFKAEGITANVEVRTIMLHMEGKTFDQHLFYTQRQRGFHMMSWDSYVHNMEDFCGWSSFHGLMADLMSLK
ncbi:hypothetical protein PVK06_049130 [Gossypium arboreum]|uniref:Uncharacterized protein n=1 Tax=Gossypium arboreum TaxID=29729 RepID=A0ABR0MHV8_GOSAR|nr:hypothetical protein PVK06_049130 [Gossypium arboreum]